MQLLVDGDIIAFRCAASVEPSTKAEPRTLTPEETNFEREIAIARCDTLMRELIHTTGADTYQCFLSGRGNFRYQVYPEYKANRRDTIDPRFRKDCKDFLVTEWHAEYSEGCEADDLLGICQTDDTIIASIDKDLLMIPGQHYNWVRDEQIFVDGIDGIKHLYKQMLIGDKADNIIGVQGLGPVKSGRIIDHLETEEEMIEEVFNLYDEDAVRFLQNVQCLWIMRNVGETWINRINLSTLPNQLKHEAEVMLSSMKFSMGDILMEPITSNQKTFGIPVVGVIPDSMETQTVALI
jgi:5'-3' exonuclease